MSWVLEIHGRVVTADQLLPGLSVLELLELVGACSPSSVRVMVSGQSDLTGVIQRKKLEAIDRLLRKPWDGEELKTALRSLLART